MRCTSRFCLMLRACSQLLRAVHGAGIRSWGSGGSAPLRPCSRARFCPCRSSLRRLLMSGGRLGRLCSSLLHCFASASGQGNAMRRSPHLRMLCGRPRPIGRDTTSPPLCRKRCSPCSWEHQLSPPSRSGSTRFGIHLPPCGRSGAIVPLGLSTVLPVPAAMRPLSPVMSPAARSPRQVAVLLCLGLNPRSPAQRMPLWLASPHAPPVRRPAAAAEADVGGEGAGAGQMRLSVCLSHVPPMRLLTRSRAAPPRCAVSLRRRRVCVLASPLWTASTSKRPSGAASSRSRVSLPACEAPCARPCVQAWN